MKSYTPAMDSIRFKVKRGVDELTVRQNALDNLVIGQRHQVTDISIADEYN